MQSYMSLTAEITQLRAKLAKVESLNAQKDATIAEKDKSIAYFHGLFSNVMLQQKSDSFDSAHLPSTLTPSTGFTTVPPVCMMCEGYGGVICVNCNGAGMYSTGGICVPCNGTGYHAGMCPACGVSTQSGSFEPPMVVCDKEEAAKAAKIAKAAEEAEAAEEAAKIAKDAEEAKRIEQMDQIAKGREFAREVNSRNAALALRKEFDEAEAAKACQITKDRELSIELHDVEAKRAAAPQSYARVAAVAAKPAAAPASTSEWKMVVKKKKNNGRM
jgi:hypothetical protein